MEGSSAESWSKEVEKASATRATTGREEKSDKRGVQCRLQVLMVGLWNGC